MKTLRPKDVPLDRRLDALRTAVTLGEGRLPQEEIDEARAVLERSAERLALGSDLTVVALAGATGSGKSSLFNALAATELSQVGVRRPTTSSTSAAVWGDVDADALLNWLKVDKRHRVEVRDNRGLVLLDLPDHDSTQASHRAEVDRLVERVDVFVWVVDPQKYADALLHENYLRPFARHAPATVVVLNQIDKLSPEERRSCIEDLTRLLDRDGLDHMSILGTSARMGLGLPELRALIAARVDEKTAATQRLAADVDSTLDRLDRFCSDGSPAAIRRNERLRLTAALTHAAGGPLVADAAARSYRREATLAAGWPFTRWVRRLRPDPLARLHLGQSSGGGRTSVNVAAANRAEIENAVRATVASGSAGLAEPWPTVIRDSVRPIDGLLDDLDRAVGRADVGSQRRPRWWTLIGLLQKVLALAAVAGFVWLTVLFVLEWLQVPPPPTPEVESLPWPTLLLVGGLVGGLAVSLVSGWFARLGAARRHRRATRAVADEVAEVADVYVLGPIAEEQRIHSDLCRALGAARRTAT